MNTSIDILIAELERLFSLDEMTSMSKRLLGLDPEDVGGISAKASFARALTQRCVDGDGVDALVDVILASRHGADPRLREVGSPPGREEVDPGQTFGAFEIVRKIGESPLSIVYAAHREQVDCTLKVIRREACRDRRAVQRFLAANRMIAALEHEGLPSWLEVGETDGVAWVSYYTGDAQWPLSAELARTGPLPLGELRPLLRGILEPLAVLHSVRIAHGALKLENVLVDRLHSAPSVTLIDFATDRLRPRATVANGHSGLLAVFGSPKTIAPEQVRGSRAEPATDVYAFGAMMYELLCGSPVFAFENATDAAFAHVARTPDPPSLHAPAGRISRDVDQFVLGLLAKDPERRPRDATAVLETIDAIGRGPASIRPVGIEAFSDEELTARADALIASPDDERAAGVLEQAIEEGADPLAVAAAFEAAAAGVTGDDASAVAVKKSLLLRAGRLFDGPAENRERAEAAYVQLLELDPDDVDVRVALEGVRKALGKFTEVVESLIGRSESAQPGEARSRIFAEIGRLCATELEDPDQGLLAYARALCETPMKRDLADEIERLAQSKQPSWNEVLATITAAIQGQVLSDPERNRLLAYAGRWYDQKLGRTDLALLAYQQILANDPGNEEAHVELATRRRKAKQWPELVAALIARADSLGESPKARDLRADAAEVLETRLDDSAKASELYAAVLAEDPGHLKAAEGMIRLADSKGDSKVLVSVLEGLAGARTGREKVDTWIKLGEVYEQQLDNFDEAARRYRDALSIEPDEPAALKGLARVYERTGKYRELLDNLQRQAAGAATPRQKVLVYERMASLYEDEFLDHASAAECLEDVLAVDPSNDVALAKLPAQYRALGHWEQLQALFGAHAERVAEDSKRIDLLLQQAKVLADNIGSPDRATRVYERILELESGHATALEALARLREQSGDAHAALQAIESLAANAPSSQARAEQWMRAARLLEAHGDRDGAIDRYKLAIEADPGAAPAARALRQAYSARGDAASVVVLIERELALAEGKISKARLRAELARVQREQLHDNEHAESNALAALELDPTNADAELVLGDIAYEKERFIEATKHLEPLIARASTLPKEDAVRVLVRFVEAYGKTLPPPPIVDHPSHASIMDAQPRLATAVEAFERLAPDDPQPLARVARVMFESGDFHSARRLYERMLDEYGADLSSTDRADALWRLGDSLRHFGELDRAVDALQEAADADPENPAPLKALAAVYEETGDWEEFVRTKRRRLEVASGSERFELLVAIGDAEFKRLNDLTRAGQTYRAALEEQPDDRKLLTKLMELYSEQKDWAGLVDVVLRLATFVADPKQRAKYMHTAAKVTARQLGEIDQAIEYYDRALEFDPGLVKAMDEVVELRLQKSDYGAIERLLNIELDHAKQLQDKTRIVHALDRLGELYAKSLNETGLAIDAYETAQAFDPDGAARTAILADLYASDVAVYLDKAVRAQGQILRANPQRTESYKLLRRLYTEARMPDPAWCLCQALVVLGLAEPDEQRFYLRHRADNAAPAQAVLEDTDWTSRIIHPDADPLLTTIFALIQPTIVRARTQTLEELGFDPAYRIDVGSQPYPVCQTIYYAQGVFGFDAPPVFQNPNDPAGLGFLHARIPAIVLGIASFDETLPNQSLAFAVGRHMTYFRPGFYVRHLVPTGTGLKGWLFAAVKHCVPQFPIAQDVQGQVNEALGYIVDDFQGVSREVLASTVSKLLQSGGSIDLKKWVAAIDLSADRAGLLLAHDLAMSVEVIRATEDAAGLPAEERVKEAVLYSISTPYLELRKKLQIAIDS
ncbi:MAG TPA: tetratricopeptide repeat protein [Polyangiaceae bacterium]|nr:tetratricopeptide repeat protein [Polyangiaceae bacterium]